MLLSMCVLTSSSVAGSNLLLSSGFIRKIFSHIALKIGSFSLSLCILMSFCVMQLFWFSVPFSFLNSSQKLFGSL